MTYRERKSITPAKTVTHFPRIFGNPRQANTAARKFPNFFETNLFTLVDLLTIMSDNIITE